MSPTSFIKSSGRTSKAKQAVKNAQFLDIQLVYRALLLYANEYRNMRMRVAEDTKATDAYDAKLYGTILWRQAL